MKPTLGLGFESRMMVAKICGYLRGEVGSGERPVSIRVDKRIIDGFLEYNKRVRVLIEKLKL